MASNMGHFTKKYMGAKRSVDLIERIDCIIGANTSSIKYGALINKFDIETEEYKYNLAHKLINNDKKNPHYEIYAIGHRKGGRQGLYYYMLIKSCDHISVIYK